MKILVCISVVPDTTAKITFTVDNTQLNTSGLQYILNPTDEIALSKAIDLTANGRGSVTVINVGEANNEPTIRKALAIGADEAVRVNAYPSEAYFVAHQIADYFNGNSFDIILTGHESIDFNGSCVGAMVAELCNLPSVSHVKRLDLEGITATIERQIEGGKEILEVETPFVVSCIEGLADSKIPNMRGIMSARTKPLEVIEAVDVESLTRTVKYYTPPQRGAVRILSPDETGLLVELLHNEAKVI